MKSIAIIGCYFGKLREDYKTWLLSCKYNPTIDWIIFTDCNLENVPQNVKIIHINFEDLKKYIQKSFDFNICLDKPYKLCDYKPAYGYIFQEYLKAYDLWGYCDFDMIFGNIRKFITDDILENYEKIYTKGHFSLYRNIPKMNELFKSDKGRMFYKDVYTTNIVKIFDEEEIHYIAVKNNCKVYEKYEYVDLHRFSKELINNSYTLFKNYKQQAFLFDKGKLEFAYCANHDIIKKEIIYIHYSGKFFSNNKELVSFQLTSKGIKEIDENNYFKYDHYKSFLYIKLKIRLRELIYRIKRKSSKIRMKIVERSRK